MDTVYKLKKDQADWLLRISEPYQSNMYVGLMVLDLRRRVNSSDGRVLLSMGVIKAGLATLWQHTQPSSLITLITNVGFRAKSGFDPAKGRWLNGET